ncbi:hypothetical protein [Caldicellulosiruptor sp. DIB 104C]|uniref:hypothetical protein n=1 Tax=Caldicellulosiruptor sp. DIB 104C TaxID=3019889 RepID=UPI0023054E58|nr:hypothetical protein [Caldicellulosiruptor sp. DIB 104C]
MTIFFAIASTILGSIIGAGFSTGQEVFYFFSRYKTTSFWYIAVASFLILLILLYFSNSVFENGILNRVLRLYIMLFSFVTLIVMFSAFGQLGFEFLRINKYFFTILCFVLSIIIYGRGFASVINVNKVVVSLLISTIFIVFLKDTFSKEVLLQFDVLTDSLKKLYSTPLSPILYATYNSLLAFPVIYKLKNRFKPRELKVGIIIASILIFILLNFINIIILSNPSSQTSQMPLLKATDNHVLQAILILCTFLEILTTILANYVGLCYSIKSSEIQNIIMITALLLGFNGFEQLLRSLYSLMGYLGIGVIMMMLLSTFLKKRQLK